MSHTESLLYPVLVVCQLSHLHVSTFPVLFSHHLVLSNGRMKETLWSSPYLRTLIVEFQTENLSPSANHQGWHSVSPGGPLSSQHTLSNMGLWKSADFLHRQGIPKAPDILRSLTQPEQLLALEFLLSWNIKWMKWQHPTASTSKGKSNQ